MTCIQEYGWRNESLQQNIPHITREEWPVIFANCNDEELTVVVNLYHNPGQMMPNDGTGRDTPTRSYFQFLGTTFNHQVRNGGTPTAPGTLRDRNNRVIPISVQNPAVSSLQLGPPVTTILRAEHPQPVPSAQVRFTSNILDTANPIPALLQAPRMVAPTG